MGYVNKFDFEIGKEYEFYELPKEIQSDIEVQFDVNYDDGDTFHPHYQGGIEEYKWKFKLLQPKEIEEWVVNHFGEYNISDEVDSRYIRRLIGDIKKRGLDFPSVGTEGNHRALIHWYLKIPLPYLEPIYKGY